jgi:hypothetical protein
LRTCPIILSALAIASLQTLAVAQSALPNAPSPSSSSTSPPQPQPAYERPSEKILFRNYAFDSIGPYPLFIAAANAGIHQATDNPREWGQGFDGYARRGGSSYGISFVSTTTRYGLAEAFHEDTLYYPCACKGAWPRLRHAVLSSFTGRYGSDGHREFSVPSVVAPYAGTFTAVELWYPRRFGAGDALRMGSYSLLGYAVGNISLEFIYGGPHSLLAHAHLPIPTNTAPQTSQP